MLDDHPGMQPGKSNETEGNLQERAGRPGRGAPDWPMGAWSARPALPGLEGLGQEAGRRVLPSGA